MRKEKITQLIVSVSILFMGVKIIQKLNDLQAEIEYFEHEKGISFTRKEYSEYLKRKEKEEEA